MFDPTSFGRISAVRQPKPLSGALTAPTTPFPRTVQQPMRFSPHDSPTNGAAIVEAQCRSYR